MLISSLRPYGSPAVPSPMVLAFGLTLVAALALGTPADLRAQDDPVPWTMRFTALLDGSGQDVAAGVALDRTGAIYVAGTTASDDLPVLDMLSGFQGGPVLGMDVFVAKYAPDGTPLFTTYVGGSGDDVATALALAPDGAILVGGMTSSEDFPSTEPALPFQGGSRWRMDGFLLRLRGDGSAIEYATTFGGTDDETVTVLTVGADEAVYVGGATYSDDLPVTAGALQAERGGPEVRTTDAFIARFVRSEERGLAFDYATYLGGRIDETVTALAAEPGGALWMAGTTNSIDFPLRAPVQDAFAGPMREQEGDVWLARLAPDRTALTFSTYFGGRRNDQAAALGLDAAGDVYLAGTTASADFPRTVDAPQAERRGTLDGYLARFEVQDGQAELAASTYFGAGDSDFVTGGTQPGTSRGLWVTGTTRSRDFPVRGAEPVLSGDSTDAFLARLDPATGAMDTSFLFSSSAHEMASGVAASAGRVCLVGMTSSGSVPGMPVGTSTTEGASFLTCLEPEPSAMSVDDDAVVPARPTLDPSYPNPFRHATALRYTLPEPGPVRLTVTDLHGRRVAVVQEGWQQAGRHTVAFRAEGLASGVYFYTLETDRYRATRTMLLVR